MKSESAARSARARPPDPGELALGPATRLLWRSPDTIHLELGEQAVVVEGLAQALVAAIVARGPRRAGSTPIADQGVTQDLVSLTESGHLWARGTDPEDPRLAAPLPRLHGEFTALAARHGDRAAELLAARTQSSVVIHGEGRVGAHLAALVAASGVGRVRCVARGGVRLPHTVPGGTLPADEGRAVAVAAQAAIARAAPETDTGPLPAGERPDLTVLALDGMADDEHLAALHADRAAHLVVRIGPTHGVVGPLVLPGLTSCLACADLHRADRDPAWSALAAQLALPHRYGAACAAALATVVAGVAAGQVLAFLDGEDTACVEGTLEVRPPDWRVRRRSWPIHPDCRCLQDPGPPGPLRGTPPVGASVPRGGRAQ